MNAQTETTTLPTLVKETEYYDENRLEFKAKYPDKWLLIYGANLHSTHDTIEEATEEGYKHFYPDPFLIRLAGQEQPELTFFTFSIA